MVDKFGHELQVGDYVVFTGFFEEKVGVIVSWSYMGVCANIWAAPYRIGDTLWGRVGKELVKVDSDYRPKVLATPHLGFTVRLIIVLSILLFICFIGAFMS